MYVHVRTTACRRWSGRRMEAQKNVENVSVSSFQIVAFEEDGWRRRCRRPFRPSRKDRSVVRSPNSELFRTNGGKFVSFLLDEEAGPARPSSIRRLGAVWRRLHSSHTRQCSRHEGRREDSFGKSRPGFVGQRCAIPWSLLPVLHVAIHSKNWWRKSLTRKLRK